MSLAFLAIQSAAFYGAALLIGQASKLRCGQDTQTLENKN